MYTQAILKDIATEAGGNPYDNLLLNKFLLLLQMAAIGLPA
jgi:hypothetical protein